MLTVLSNSWALLLGMGLLMVGNGLQGTLLGVRGSAAGFSAETMSVIMSAYFVGFLFASRMAPEMIRRVGHVRVFAALGSLVSAVLILFPTLQHPIAWMVGRALIGFCFCGVYVTAESWLNNAANNETRGKALSLYMIVQMVGIIVAQALLLIPDPSGFVLFVIPSVLVSIAFAPILLSISPTPAFETTKRMKLIELYHVSPLGMVGMFLLGGAFAAQFGMSAVYGASVGLSLPEITLFVSSFYIGALFLQYPIGWLSDHMDRRRLIMFIAAAGAVAGSVGVVFGDILPVLMGVALVVGGMSNPLYSLLIAYTNDFLEREDMAAASAGLLFVNGLGAIAGPLIIGWLMGTIGPAGYFVFIAGLLALMTGYALYRMTQRKAPAVEEVGHYSVFTPSSSQVLVGAVQEHVLDQVESEVEKGAAQPMPRSR